MLYALFETMPMFLSSQELLRIILIIIVVAARVKQICCVGLINKINIINNADKIIIEVLWVPNNDMSNKVVIIEPIKDPVVEKNKMLPVVFANFCLAKKLPSKGIVWPIKNIG